MNDISQDELQEKWLICHWFNSTPKIANVLFEFNGGEYINPTPNNDNPTIFDDNDTAKLVCDEQGWILGTNNVEGQDTEIMPFYVLEVLG